MIRVVILAAVLAIPGYVVHAQRQEPVIRDIRIEGNKRVNSTAILNVMASKKKAPYREPVFNEDLNRILKLYADKLFFLSSVDTVRKNYSDDSSAVSLTIFITEVKPVLIDSFTISGFSAISERELFNQAEMSTGSVFDPGMLERDMQSLLSLYENRGYPFASVRVSRFIVNESNDPPRASVTIDVSEGARIILKKAEFTGQKQTREETLRRTANIRLPAPFSQKAADNSVTRLRKLAFIEKVGGPHIFSENDTVYGLRYDIAEGPSNRFDGIAGYVPKRPNANEKGYFTGMIQLSFQNLFGTARKLDAHWQKKDRYSQDFMLAYTEPWVLNYPLEAGVFIQQTVQDTTYVLREYGLCLRFPVLLNADVLAGFRRKTSDPSGAANSFVFNIPYASSWTGSFGLEWDSRDDRMNARTGAFFRASVDYNRQRERFYVESATGRDTLWIGELPKTAALRTERFNSQKIGMDAEWYVPLHRRWVFFDGLHGWYYKTPRVVAPLSEQFFIGGLKTVRGYIQDQFSGSRVAWNNLELRWLATKDSRLFLFADVGYYFRKEYADAARTKLRKVSGFPAGYGFGLRFKTRIGMFGMDYGLGKGDSFSTGKIHFGITSQF